MASLESVPPANRSEAAFKKAVTLMAHIMAARQLWLFRFGIASDAPTDFFPADVPLPDLAERVERAQEAWVEYRRRLDETELARVFEYKSLDGDGYRNTVEDILTQLFGHSWYHRGQIAMLVRAAGGEPAVTDLIYWCRESIPS